MTQIIRSICLVCALAIMAALFATPMRAGQDRTIAIRGGTVITITGATISNGTVIMRGGKITAVGANPQIPAGAEIVDATGKYVMPGLIDAMTSIAMETTDLNETSNPMTPDLRVIENYNPFGNFGEGQPGPIRLSEPLSGGVTTMYIAPADTALIGGQGAVVKTAGTNLASVIVRESAAMDMTLGEQPKKAARSRNRDPATRMAEVAMLRQILIKAQEYERNRSQNPSSPRDLGMEALGRVLRREIPARIQSNTVGDIRSALALAREFGFDLIIDGGASSYEHRQEMAERKVAVVLGQVTHPYVSNEEIPDRAEYPPLDERTPAKLAAAGVKIAIASFSRAFGRLAPGGTGKWLLVDAATAGGYGLSNEDILRSVTINAAEILGVSDRVGSLTEGKDADLIVLDGPPLSIKTWVERVYVNGELVHTRKAR